LVSVWLRATLAVEGAGRVVDRTHKGDRLQVPLPGGRRMPAARAGNVGQVRTSFQFAVDWFTREFCWPLCS
jgi:hypothetical protein